MSVKDIKKQMYGSWLSPNSEQTHSTLSKIFQQNTNALR